MVMNRAETLRSKGNGQVLTHREPSRALERERDLVGPIGIVSGYFTSMYGCAADRRIPAWTSDQAGMSEIGTCGEEALHGDVRHAGLNNTTGGQPGAATYWALLLTMCGPAESIYAAELPEAIREHVAEALAATWPPPEAPKSW